MSEAKFKKAVEIIKNLPKDGPVNPTTADQLYFYSYYKQATVGDIDAEKPGFLDFAGRAKWDAWNERKGVSKEEAWSKYVDKLVELLKASETEEEQRLIDEINAA